MQIALADRQLTIAICNQEHADNVSHRSLDQPHHFISIGNSYGKEVHLSKNPDLPTVIEELAHHALRRIYSNKSQPFIDSDDRRRSLLSASIIEDVRRNSVKQYKKDFEMGSYELNDTYAEVPVKVITMMFTGKWDQIRDRYPVIDSYMTQVLFKDIKTFEDVGQVAAYGVQAERLAQQSTRFDAPGTGPTRRPKQ